jgi:hypothetical protein
MPVVSCKRCKQSFSIAEDKSSQRSHGMLHSNGVCECEEGPHPICVECTYTIKNSAAKQFCPDCGVPILIEE